MAASVTDQEREERVLFVGNYFLEHADTSIRKAAQDISKHYFKISTATIHDYLNRFKKLAYENQELIEEHMKNNKEENIDDERVRSRIIIHAQMCIAGLTVEEIAKTTSAAYWTVYRDLKSRLPKVDINLSTQVQEILNNHKNNNLKK